MFDDKNLPALLWVIGLLIFFVIAVQLGINQGRKMERRESVARGQLSEGSGQGSGISNPTPERRAPITVRITAYPPLSKCTDSTPFITASNQRVRPGIIALSRDIEQQHGLRFGDRVHIYGLGTFEFQDRMHARHTAAADIFMWREADCREFGVRYGVMEIL